MTAPAEVLQRALAKWRNAYAAQKQAEATHRAAVEQLDAAEYELAIVLGVAPPRATQPPPPPPWMPPVWPPNVAPQYAPPAQPAPAAMPIPQPIVQGGAVIDDGRPADEIVLEYMQRNNAGGGGGG